MKSFRQIAQALALASIAFIPIAQAATVTFEDVASGIFPLPVTSSGFNFTGTGAVGVTANGSECTPLCSSNGTNRLLAPGATFGATSITMSRVNGQSFLLLALDAAEMFSGFPNFDAAQIDYLGYLGANLVISGALVLDLINDGPGGVADFQTFTIAGSALVDRIVFTGAGGIGGNNAFALDNLVTSSVPEPGSLTLVGLCLAGLVASRRRRV